MQEVHLEKRRKQEQWHPSYRAKSTVRPALWEGKSKEAKYQSIIKTGKKESCKNKAGSVESMYLK